MGSISSLSSYLSNLLTNPATSSGSGSSNSSASAASAIQALEQELSGTSSSSGSGVGSYLLDLSPAAQQILSGAASTSSSSGSSSSTQFTLTKAQQATIENIINKYKDAPFTQATFTDIENDLKAAGLSPQQLAARDEITSFNPTNVLLGDLSGNYTSITSAATTLSNEQTKENNFLEDIAKLWKSVSTTASSGSGSSKTTSGSGASSSSGVSS
jgi:hypothetical protein